MAAWGGFDWDYFRVRAHRRQRKLRLRRVPKSCRGLSPLPTKLRAGYEVRMPTPDKVGRDSVEPTVLQVPLRTNAYPEKGLATFIALHRSCRRGSFAPSKPWAFMGSTGAPRPTL